jgi:outer membrane protein
VNTSAQASPNVQIAQLALEIATLEVARAKSAHMPTLDLAASMSGTRNVGGTSNSGTSALSSHVLNKSIGVVLNLPLFAGFSSQNRVRETVELADKAEHDLDFAKRTAAQATRAAYLNLVSGVGQVGALKAAQSSSQLALESNMLGYRVGVRINIDVLNAQSQLYQTQRDLATAKYAVLMGELKLKQANGTLEPRDLIELNNMLAP